MQSYSPMYQTCVLFFKLVLLLALLKMLILLENVEFGLEYLM